MRPKNLRRLLRGLNWFCWATTALGFMTAGFALLVQSGQGFFGNFALGFVSLYTVHYTSRKLVFFEPIANVLQEAKRLQQSEAKR